MKKENLQKASELVAKIKSLEKILSDLRDGQRDIRSIKFDLGGPNVDLHFGDKVHIYAMKDVLCDALDNDMVQLEEELEDL